jgi:hypothetical protein
MRWNGELVTQLIAGDHFVFATSEATLAAVSTSTGSLAWTTTLSALPSMGVRASILLFLN